jgi:cytochrome P450
VLGEHPELAARVRAEADDRLGDAIPTVAQGRALAYADSVSREVLRAYPIVPTTFLGVARKDLEHAGYGIRAGWKGAGAIWATLQDGSTFRDPTRFDGERLAPAAMVKLHASAFVPQGGGPADGHRCAGEALIKVVMPAFLGWFTRRYDLALPRQDTRPGRGGVGPLPTDGLRVRVTKRAGR